MTAYGVIPVDRSVPFSFDTWGLTGWSIASQSEHTHLVSSLPLAHVHFVRPMWEREDSGDPRYLRLDMYAFEALWKHRLRLTAWWKDYIPAGSSFFQFYCDGVIFLNEFGCECVLYIRYGPDWDKRPWRHTYTYDWSWGWTPVKKNWGSYFAALALPIQHAEGEYEDM